MYFPYDEIHSYFPVKTERPLTVSMAINKNDTPPLTLLRKHQEFRTTFLNKIFGELLLIFQLFNQFDLEIRCFTFSFQKLISNRIF